MLTAILMAAAASAAGADVTVKVDAPPRLISDGVSSFDVRARVTGVDAPYDLELLGSSSAYPGKAVFRSTATGAASFSVVPAVTATYRVRAVAGGGAELARSEAFTVIAHPRITLAVDREGGGVRLRTTARIDRGPARLKVRPGSATEAVFYYRLRRASSFKRFSPTDLAKPGCTRTTCIRRAELIVYDTTLLSGIESFRVCFPGRLFAGAGAPSRCPPRMPV